ncbi:hypothetical protein TNCV_2926831 [Trichonephila clavipes]|nr:hypothetical protein TNCV_2926831 [Trichonephila clavipes]
MDEDRTTKKFFNAQAIGTRRNGGPNLRWIDGQDKGILVLRTKNWRTLAERRLAWNRLSENVKARPRILYSRRKQFFPKLHASSGTMAQTLKGSYLGMMPLWPTDPLYHCRDFCYGPEHKKSGCHSLGSTE